jgi:hypothetical protein
VTNGGVTATGPVLAEDDKTITLSVAGVPTAFQRQDLKSLTYQLTPQEDYAQRRARLADTDSKGRLALAQWAYDQGLLDLALGELTDLRQRAPGNDDVALLLRLVDKAIADRAAATGPAAPEPAAVPAAPQTPPPAAKMLTPDDINLIRIWDIDLRTQPNVIIPRAVIDTLFNKYGADPAVPAGQGARDAFFGLKGYQQLRIIFDVNASQGQKLEDFYSKITVTDDPPSIMAFRMFHQNYVVGYCATSKCHAPTGAGSGKLTLFTRDSTSPTTVYTNYFVLQSYVSGKTAMVDREHPELSLLIQYGMARVNAIYPHPDATGWRQAFANGQAPLPVVIRDWVRKLGTPRFPYPFSYSPPIPPLAPAPAPAAP